jgi:hypothetical protein
MSYPGGKAMEGTYQRIINLIPPHDVFVEPFAGSAAIARLKRPARRTILIDLDPRATDALRAVGSRLPATTGRNGDRVPAQTPASDRALPRLPTNTQVVEADGIAWLEYQPDRVMSSWFVYADPPYLPETCKSRCPYRFGMGTKEHLRLLEVLKELPCPVMISGRWSRLYAEQLGGWASHTWYAMNRGGSTGEETIWMNYAEPTALHDYRYLGRDYRQRENLARRRRRWVARLQRMDTLQRQMLLMAMQEVLLGPPPADPAVEAHSGGNGDGRSSNGRSGGDGHHRSTSGGNGEGGRAGKKKAPRPRPAKTAVAAARRGKP